MPDKKQEKAPAEVRASSTWKPIPMFDPSLSLKDAIETAVGMVHLERALGLKCAPEVQQLLMAAQVLLENEKEEREQSEQAQERRGEMRRHVSLFLKTATGKVPPLSWRDEMVFAVRLMGTIANGCAVKNHSEKGCVEMFVSVAPEQLRDMPLTRAHAETSRLDKDDLKARVARLLRSTPRARWRELGDRLTAALLCATGLTSKEAWKLIPKPEKMQKHPILEIPAETRKVFDDPSKTRKHGPRGGSPA